MQKLLTLSKIGLQYLRLLTIKYYQNAKILQILMLFAVTLVGIPIGIATSIVLTRFLGAKSFGDFQFLNNLFNLAIILLTFGFLQATNRLLVINSDKKKAREYYGATLVILLVVFLLITLSLFIYSIFDLNLKAKGLNNFILYLLPFSWLFLLINYFEVLFQADNKMTLLSASRLFPKIGFLLAVLVIYMFYMNTRMNRLGLIWALYILTQLIVFVGILKKIKPSLKNLNSRIIEIWNANKEYGFHVYLGSIFAVGIAQLAVILISYFGVDNSQVGYFSLAISFASPLQFIPNTIATTHYREFALQSVIPPRLIRLTVFLTLFSLVMLWIVVPPFILSFYGPDFQSVIYLTFIVSLGMAFHGTADFFNRFLGANGKGKLLRNSSFIVGISILVVNLLLIPLLGANGAAFTRLIGGVIYLTCMLIYYARTIKLSSANPIELKMSVK